MEATLYAFSPASRRWGVRPPAEQQRLLGLRTVPTAHQRLLAVFAASRERPPRAELAQAA